MDIDDAKNVMAIAVAMAITGTGLTILFWFASAIGLWENLSRAFNMAVGGS